MRAAGRFSLGMMLSLVVCLAATEAPPTTTAQDATLVAHTQDLWIFLQAGEDATFVDRLLVGLTAAAERTFDLSDGFQFTETPAVHGTATSAAGTLLPNVTITAGVLSGVDAAGNRWQAPAVFSTADISGGRPNLQAGDQVSVRFGDLPELAAPAGELVYAFIQTRMPENPATEAGLSGPEILARRWSARSIQVLGAAGDGIDAVQSPLLADGNTRWSLSIGAAQVPAGPGLTWDPKPAAGLPPRPGALGVVPEALNRLGEAVGWVNRQGARDYNDWLQSICTPECRFRLEGTITVRQPHWEFQSTFGSTFRVGRSTGNSLPFPPETGDTYGERVTNTQGLPCTITPSAVEGPFQVTGRYDARNRRLLLLIGGSQPEPGLLYRYDCERGMQLSGTLADVETPPTGITKFTNGNAGRVMDFEVCDGMGNQPLVQPISGSFTGEARITVSWLSQGTFVTGIFGIPCVRGGPAIVAP